jgi:hypothetical protein
MNCRWKGTHPFVYSVSCIVLIYIYNRIGGGMVSMFASNGVDRWFEAQSGKTIYYEIGICCFSTKHAALRRNSKQ